MQVFHIRGFSGILLLLLAMVAAVLLLFLLPASFMMVLWNALAYEGLKAPEIDLYQGFLLWGAMLVMIKLVFKPEIKLQFQPLPTQKQSKSKPVATEAADAEEAIVKVEDATPATPLDNQN